MINQELVEYVRSEFNKGKTRKEIRDMLTASGGWSEADLNEAFNIAAPLAPITFENVQPIAPANSSIPKLGSEITLQKEKSSSPLLKFIFTFFLLGVVVFTLWNYRGDITNPFSVVRTVLDKLATSISNLIPTVNTKENKSVQELPIATNNTNRLTVRDCGVTGAPDRKYKNGNGVFDCLGNSALRCADNARAVLTNPFFPTVFEIKNDGGACNFKLSYSQDSTLMDAAGKRLAGQYLVCPVSIVKMMDETNTKAVLFKAPTRENPSLYATQIYFYGTLGVFIENNLDQNKIKDLGCSGDLIKTVIDGYHAMKSKI